jgi:hypothetical protein
LRNWKKRDRDWTLNFWGGICAIAVAGLVFIQGHIAAEAARKVEKEVQEAKESAELANARHESVLQ